MRKPKSPWKRSRTNSADNVRMSGNSRFEAGNGLPFSLDRNDRTGLCVQLTDALRHAILTGYYRDGDVLPTRERMAKALGVSLIVARGALRALTREGLVNPRPRIGCVVTAGKVKTWFGHVRFVMADVPGSYFINAFADAMQHRLVEAGYSFSRVSVLRGLDGEYDFSTLDASLRDSAAMTVLMYNSASIERHLASAGVRFVLVGKRRPEESSSAGFIRFHRDAVVPQFVRHCLSAGIKSVWQVACTAKDTDAVDALRKAGIAAREVVVRPDPDFRPPEAMERAAMNHFLRLLSSPARILPDLLFFSDDFVASGALKALSAAGVRVPADVKVVSWANRGHGPVYPVALTRMEMDPAESGKSAADAVLESIEKGSVPEGASLLPTYIAGETFPL